MQEVLLPSEVIIRCDSQQVSWRVLGYVFNCMTHHVHASYRFSISQSTPYRLHLGRKARGGVGIPQPLKDLTLEFKSKSIHIVQSPSSLGMVTKLILCYPALQFLFRLGSINTRQ
jgi:hypothetical protein